jgi:hypothetical protein
MGPVNVITELTAALEEEHAKPLDKLARSESSNKVCISPSTSF